jgi:septum site-determining protein MinD
MKITRIITIASGKGGVGKTTITANLGVALANYGEDVTLLDADVAMANLELIVGMEGRPVTLNNVLSGDADIQEAIYEGPGGMKIIPAGLSLYALRKVKIHRLKKVVESLLSQTDIILIDAPAGLEKDALAAIDVAQELIIVTTPEVPSISDALKTRMVASELGVNILGVVINREQNENTFLSSKEIETILKAPVIAKIPEDPEIRRSSAFSKPFVLKKRKSPTYNSIMQLAADIVGKNYIPIATDKKGLISQLIEGIMGKKEKIAINEEN